VIDVLGAGPGTEATSLGLEYIGHAVGIPTPLLDKLRSQSRSDLRAPVPEKRWDAGRVLAMIGDSSSIEPLENAILEENDTEYRHRLEDDLRALKARLQSSR
jgi:hypothetical protein